MCRVTETAASRPAIDFSTFDRSIRIQDDLFRHVNGTWLNTTQIPADKPVTGVMELRDQAQARFGHHHQHESGDWKRRGRDCRSVRQLHGRGGCRGRIDPVLPLLAAIDSVETLSDLTRMLGVAVRR
jgi:putative endopeptidase